MTRLDTLTRAMEALDEAELMLKNQLAAIGEIREELAKQSAADRISTEDIDKTRRLIVLSSIGAHELTKAVLVALLLERDN